LKLRLQTKIKISSEKVGLKLSPPVKTKVKCYIRYVDSLRVGDGEVERKRTNTSER